MFRKITCIAIVLTLAALLCIQACKSSSCVKKDGSGEQKPCSEELGEKLSWAEKLVYVPPLPECKEKDGEIYGKIGRFRHRWWHYYKRALSYMEGGFWDEAEKDLKKAIHQRGEDQWDARTYGMHFIDYFPNRELGIIHYYQAKNAYDQTKNKEERNLAIDKIKDARDELKRSLKQAPNAKALFYLKLAYQDLPANEKPSPVITICDCEKLQDGEVKKLSNLLPAKNNPVTLCGKVTDIKGEYIKSVYISSGNIREPLFLLNSKDDLERAKDVRFEKQFSLSHGIHPITIEAESITGKFAKKELKIQMNTIDRVAMIDKQTFDDGKVAVSGFFKNEAGISELFVNGKAVSIQQGKEVYFNKIITDTVVDKSIELAAYDDSKNKIYNGYLHLSDTTKKPILLASATSSVGNVLVANGYNDNIFPNHLQKTDTTPPNIEITNLANREEKSQKFFRIEVKVTDHTDIEELFFNKEDILKQINPERLKEVEAVKFYCQIDLNKENREGHQPNMIVATDSAGNKSRKIISIVPPETQIAQAPVIRLGNLSDGDRKIPFTYTVEGEVEFDKELEFLKINNTIIPIQGQEGNVIYFSSNLIDLEKERNTIEAVDKEGNKTILNILTRNISANEGEISLEIEPKDTNVDVGLKEDGLHIKIMDNSSISSVKINNRELKKSENREGKIDEDYIYAVIPIVDSRINLEIIDREGNKRTEFYDIGQNKVKKRVVVVEETLFVKFNPHKVSTRESRLKLFVSSFFSQEDDTNYQERFHKSLREKLDSIKPFGNDIRRFQISSCKDDRVRQLFGNLLKESLASRLEQLSKADDNVVSGRLIIDGEIKRGNIWYPELGVENQFGILIKVRLKDRQESLSMDAKELPSVIDAFIALIKRTDDSGKIVTVFPLVKGPPSEDQHSNSGPSKYDEDMALKDLAEYVANKISVEFPFLVGEITDDSDVGDGKIVTDIKNPKLKIHYPILAYKPEGNSMIGASIIEKSHRKSKAQILNLENHGRYVPAKGDKVITE